MAFTSSATFPGDFYDGALRLAAQVPARREPAPATEGSAHWRQMLELGWQGVRIDEAAGGAGGTLADLAALVEALARHAVNAPLIDRAAVATAVLARFEKQQALLESVAAGEASVCTVLQRPRAELQMGADGRLSGALRGADLSEPASHVLFDVHAGPESVLVLLPLAGLASRMRHYTGVDGRSTADIDLNGLAPDDRAIVGRGKAVDGAVRSAARIGGLLTCVQAVAASGAMVEQTIEYLHTRQQFGVALSTFQALRHRLVDMYVAYENARGLVRRLVEGGRSLDDEAAEHDIALAQLYVHGVGRQVAEGAIQLHGGMGMSLETPAARLALHCLASALQFGDRSQWLDTLAARMATELQEA